MLTLEKIYNIMILEKVLTYRSVNKSKQLSTLFDSGASYSCVHPKHIENFATLIPLPEPIELETAQDGAFLRVTDVVRLAFTINDIPMSDEFLIIPSLSEEAIIGAYTMQKWKIKLDFEHDEIVTNPKVARLRLK